MVIVQLDVGASSRALAPVRYDARKFSAVASAITVLPPATSVNRK